MAIIHIATTKEEAERLGTNVRSCDANNDGKIILWLYDTHIGLCIQSRERNGYDDSDWDMQVWNDAKGAPEWIEYASTRGWSYPCHGSRPDATQDVMAKFEEWDARRQAEERRLHQDRLDKMPAKGKTLRVIKGRKVPKGTEGICMWSSVEFKRDRVLGILFMGYQGRVGIRDSEGGVHFTSVANVEVVA